MKQTQFFWCTIQTVRMMVVHKIEQNPAKLKIVIRNANLHIKLIHFETSLIYLASMFEYNEWKSTSFLDIYTWTIYSIGLN